MNNQRIIIIFLSIILTILSVKKSEAQLDQDPEGAALGLALLSLVVPSYCSLTYYDESTSKYVTEKSFGSTLDVEFLLTYYILLGTQFKLVNWEYGKFSPVEGTLKLYFGLGIPFNDYFEDGFYLGLSTGVGLFTPQDDINLKYILGGIMYFGYHNIGFIFALDKYKNDFDPDLYTTQFKLHIYNFAIGYTQYLGKMNNRDLHMNHFTLGLVSKF